VGDWFDYPQEAIAAEIGSRWYVPPWSLETLVNEYLTASMTPNSSNRRLNCRTWPAFSHVHNLLHDLEDVESVSDHADVEILDAIQRLGWRHFPWQQGMVNANKLYRSWYLYNFTESNKFLLEGKGLTVENLTKIGFVLP
jgi:hypothetical protein